ncbi:reverse transcriptase family protein [Vibrio splendidus]|uniref:reverse transcriptase family protein n=1 Tax=Vibrio splendidus TaxID=29497 RepID=UPI000314DD9B|nr:reverse transcriptase family protein [Vibrio splendidus]OEF29995.1 retron-type reverse transcriptase [Vibrio splendidus 1S-124]PTQ21550.1 RNA-directed DNA polymerase [Vibrio splendidus]
MKYRKLTTKTFLSILSDEIIDQLELSRNPIQPYTVKDVKHGKIGTKSIFKLAPAKSQYLERLNQKFFSNIEVNNSAVAYVGKKSYLDMFEPHRNNANFLRLDIKSFFHSINREALKKTFSAYISDEVFCEDGKSKQPLIDAFLNLISLNVTKDYNDPQLVNKSILPIGFKSSPVISNIIFRRFDILIQELCSRSGISYTRYADDMLFSSPSEHTYLHTNKFFNEISYILSLGEFKINTSKTIKDKNMISINGYVIESKGDGRNGTIRISEKKTKKIYKLIYMMEKGVPHKVIMNRVFRVQDRDIVYNFKKGKEEFKKKFYKTQTRNRLTGYRAYIISILKFNDKYQCIEAKYVSEYQTIVESLEKQIYKVI